MQIRLTKANFVFDKNKLALAWKINCHGSKFHIKYFFLTKWEFCKTENDCYEHRYNKISFCEQSEICFDLQTKKYQLTSEELSLQTFLQEIPYTQKISLSLFWFGILLCIQ